MTQDKFIPVQPAALSYNQQGQKKAKRGKSPDISPLQVSKRQIASHGSVGLAGTVAVTNAFCDKIRVVGFVRADSLSASKLSAEEQVALLQDKWAAAAQKLSPKKTDEPMEEAKFKFVEFKGYKAGKTRVGSGKASAVVGVGTGKSKAKTGFRLVLEFNPHRLRSDGIKALEGVVTSLFSDALEFDRWLATAKASSMDFAVDLINLDVCDAILRSELGDKWSGWFGRMGRVETWSHLAPKNKHGKRPPKVRLYDKRRQLLDAKKEPEWGQFPHARLEVRQAQGQRVLAGLGNIGNPFLQISMGHAGLVAHAELRDFRLYLAATRWMGLVHAEKLIPESKRPKWNLQITHTTAPFWKPEQMWIGWRESLIADGLWDWVVRAAKAKEQLKKQGVKT